ncbi:nitrate reductase [Chaetomium sp. MPI-SDFR-AT-0129]|nr:nitrate reductase [Chaetomium sp. MPI-SDFR-AT-0129]
MADTFREITIKEVAEHTAKSDGWIVIHGKVYNVTDYIVDHPGGVDVLVDVLGRDATEEYDNAGHSEDASEIMAEFCVGTLKKTESQKPKPKAVRLVAKLSPKPSSPSHSSSLGSSSTTSINNTTLILGSAAATLSSFGAYYLTRTGTPIWLPSLPLLTLHNWLPSPTSITTRSTPTYLQGFLTAAALSTALTTLITTRSLSHLLRLDSGFTRYPPHLKLPRSIPPNPLLQRGWLDPVHYRTLPLTHKHLIAPNVYRLTFALPTPDTVLGLPTGQHLSIRAVLPPATPGGEERTVTRSYTPVSNNKDRGMLELVVKCYPDGLLTGGYLAHLKVGDEVAFRGPKGAMRYECPHYRSSSGKGAQRSQKGKEVKKIGMVAGGSGITPMWQVIRAICEDERDCTEVSLVYANRSEGDILMRGELERYARRYPGNLKVFYLVDREPPAGEEHGLKGLEFGVGYVTKEVLRERLPAPGEDVQVMVCGPPGMVEAAKRGLVELGFEKPGVSAKMEDQVFCF